MVSEPGKLQLEETINQRILAFVKVVCHHGTASAQLHFHVRRQIWKIKSQWLSHISNRKQTMAKNIGGQLWPENSLPTKTSYLLARRSPIFFWRIKNAADRGGRYWECSAEGFLSDQSHQSTDEQPTRFMGEVYYYKLFSNIKSSQCCESGR